MAASAPAARTAATAATVVVARHDGAHRHRVASRGPHPPPPRRAQAAGATTASCFVTHGVFPNQSWKRFVGTAEKPTPFYKVWITDSIPTSAAAVEGQEPFEVLSIAPLIGNLVTGDPPLEG